MINLVLVVGIWVIFVIVAIYECNDNRGTCENKCLCILNEEIDLYVCEKEEPLFDVPSRKNHYLMYHPLHHVIYIIYVLAPSLVSNFDRSVNISNEIIQKMEEDMTGSNLLQLRPNNFDKEECRRPLQECIEYTLDYPDIPHIYLARKFYYFIISLFRNGDINNLTFNGTSDLDSIQQLDNKSQNSGSYKNTYVDVFSGSTCLSDIDFGESSTYYFFCWDINQFMIKGKKNNDNLKDIIKRRIDEKYWSIIDEIPNEILNTEYY